MGQLRAVQQEYGRWCQVSSSFQQHPVAMWKLHKDATLTPALGLRAARNAAFSVVFAARRGSSRMLRLSQAPTRSVAYVISRPEFPSRARVDSVRLLGTLDKGTKRFG